MKSQPAFNDSLEAKAVKFLKSMCMGGQESADAFLSNFGQTSDASLTDFIQSIVVLVSSSHQVITSTAIKMVMNLITRCSVRILLLLVKAALMPRLINTLNPLSLSFAEAVDIHTFLIRIISCSLWPSTPDCLQELGIKDDSEQQSVHETVLKQVLMPSDKTRQEEGKKRTKQLPSPRHPTISRPSSSFSALSTPIAHSLTCDSFSATVCVHSRFGSLCVTDRGCLLTLFTNRACPILAPSSSELHLSPFSSSPSNICRRVQTIHFRQSETRLLVRLHRSLFVHPSSREINSADICTPMPASSPTRERTCPAALLFDRKVRDDSHIASVKYGNRRLCCLSLDCPNSLLPTPTAPNLTPCIVTFLAVCVCDCFLIVLSNGALRSPSTFWIWLLFRCPSTNWE
ncbi:hypothetical protein BLNAU_25262 [Blattamonas nauphoetae]|uniref:Uncharacterized protein n=1 Tax=Blattamonas nauphoetae TaxID=2049346 RepID=A0ABQ9WK41_9EUKA|nr:hypothetical protein BLNAU_25262 [Blattamonas nauphoetae]